MSSKAASVKSNASVKSVDNDLGFPEQPNGSMGNPIGDDNLSDINDDDEEIFSFNKPQRTLTITHQALPQFVSDGPFETLNDAIDFIIGQGKNNADVYSLQMEQLWNSLGELEGRARTLLKKRNRFKKRIQEIEDIRDVFEKDPNQIYDGLFDTKPPIGRFDARSLSGNSRISTLLASDAELSDFEPISSKKSSFMVLKLENQIQSVNSQLRMLQDSLSCTEKALEKVHLANRHSLVSLIKMFRSPADHNLTGHLELTPKETLAHFAGLVVTLLKLTRVNYAIDEVALKPKHASCVMKRDDVLHTYVHIRNDDDFDMDTYADLICLMAGYCIKLGAKRGLCFFTNKREEFSKDVRDDLKLFKSKGVDIIVIFVEDLLDELPSEPEKVCQFLDELMDNIKLFTGE